MLPPLAFGGTPLATVWASLPHSLASFWLKAVLPTTFTDLSGYIYSVFAI